MFALILIAKLKRGDSPMTRKELGTPEDVLNEVEVYVSYELKTQAIKLLKAGSKAYPTDQRIRRKLAELTK